MVIDTSALLAILLDEPDSQWFSDSISEAPVRLVSAATLIEASVVLLSRGGEAAIADLDRLVAMSRVTIIPVTEQHVAAAREGFSRFGKGRHRAALNFGDCFSYALAKVAGHPLLFKGSDFSQTDIQVASAGA